MTGPAFTDIARTGRTLLRGRSSSCPAKWDAVDGKDVVLALPRDLREVLVLSRFGGLTYEEIARERGVSVQTVQLRLTRPLALLQAKLEGRR